MQQINADQQLVLTLLKELLSQRCAETPNIQLQRYDFALRSLVYASPRSSGGPQTAAAYYVLVEAMHLIFHIRQSVDLPWLDEVEDSTYDAFLRLQKL